MNKSDEWLEAELGRCLGPVAAPGELWSRVQRPRRAHSHPRAIWALAAVLPLLALVWAVHSKQFELLSGDGPSIRAWVKAGTGLDVPLPAVSPASVQLTGAHVVKASPATVEIAYRVNNRAATLAVSKAEAVSGDGKHRFLSPSSWTMRGQLYTVAFADGGNLSAACLLCHAGASRS